MARKKKIAPPLDLSKVDWPLVGDNICGILAVILRESDDFLDQYPGVDLEQIASAAITQSLQNWLEDLARGVPIPVGTVPPELLE